MASTTSNGVSLFFSCFLLLLVSFIHASSLHHCEADSSSSSSSSNKLPLVKGLSWSFHESTCPNLHSLIRKHLKKVFTDDIGLAAGLLRLHFHDCFVQGCDGSVLLDGSASGPSEKEAPPNLSLRAEAFRIIEDLRAIVHRHCGSIVSCADIVAIAARDSVFLSGGPEYEVPLGRRDGLNFATRNATLANLPAPTSNATVILDSLATKGFDPADVVALSGGHTIGISHCNSFTNRLYPTQDPIMDNNLADNLKVTCPTENTNNTAVMDFRTPNLFDNKYYVGLVNRQGLFTSDQDLFSDERTKETVREFAEDQSVFFWKFAEAMVKMGQLGVLTGNGGEIRGNCSMRNQDYESFLKRYKVEDVEEDRSEL